MKNKIIIFVSIIIAISVASVFIFIQNEPTEKQLPSQVEEDEQISQLLKKVEEGRIASEEAGFDMYKPREWITSGPFQIDRSVYHLGEKIFISFEPFNEKGKAVMIFAKIINATHSQQYKKIDFTGSEKEKNVYFAIYPSLPRQFCTVDDIIGDWEVSFPGTNLEKIQFKVLDKMIPGMDYSFGPVC